MGTTAKIATQIPNKNLWGDSLMHNKPFSLLLSAEGSKHTIGVQVVITSLDALNGSKKDEFSFEGYAIDSESNTAGLKSLGLPEEMEFTGTVNFKKWTGCVVADN